MKAIGGYFELADYEEGKGFPHQDGILLNTGRNALEYILRSIGDVKCIYLPYYTCEVVLEPLKKLHIPWTFYHINSSFEMVEDIQPKVGEYIIANNYFGIKDSYIKKLAEKYGDYLIVDCAQALFAIPITNIKMFYSTRKYVGVGDGGVAYLGHVRSGKVEVNGEDQTANHDKHLFTRKLFGAEAGFKEFQENEAKLNNQPIRWMSNTTKRILDHIDYDKLIAIRRTNYSYLHDNLIKKNLLQLPDLDSFICPMVYPLMTNIDQYLRKELINNKIYVAKYWPNIEEWCSPDVLEYNLSQNLVCLPIDQRYNIREMDLILDMIARFV